VTAPIFQILDDAHDNVRLALSWCVDARRATEGLVLIRGLAPLWMWVGMPVDGRRWVEAMLDLAAASVETMDVPPALHAQALMLGGGIASMDGDYVKARTFSEASVALWRTLGDNAGLALALPGLTHQLLVRGDFEQAEAVQDEALALARADGDPFILSGVMINYGRLALAHKQYERAAAYLRDSLPISRTVERTTYRSFAMVRALVLLGRAESKLGRSNEATLLFKQALAEMRESGLGGFWLGYCLDWIAAHLATRGDATRAAQLLGAADRHWRAIRMSRPPLFQVEHDEEVRAVQAQLDAAAFERAWDEGRAMDSASVFAFTLDDGS
jgi:tetratricopeptide (TPR) repeat protein